MTDKDRDAHARPHHAPGEVTEADEAEEARDLSEDEAEEKINLAADVPEADALEQARSWDRGSGTRKVRIPIDVPEADALDQARSADIDDEDDRH